MPLVYDELRALARRHLRDERPDHTLGATALVHEAWLRLAGADVEWANRLHFFSLAAGVMRRILVDHARKRGRLKRGGGLREVSLDEALVIGGPEPDILALDESLRRLAAIDDRKSRVVELHYFGGLTYGEVGDVLGISSATVDRDLRMAKAWLYDDLRGDGHDDGS